MRIDHEDHKLFLLKLIEGAQIPGQILELAHAVKLAVEGAEVGVCEMCQKGNEVAE